MAQHDHHRQPKLPARMKDGAWEEFSSDQPNVGTGKPPAPDESGEGELPAPPPPRIRHDDPVEEASDESFPASDPPSWTP